MDANTNTIPVEGEKPMGVIFNLLIRGTALALGSLGFRALKKYASCQAPRKDSQGHRTTETLKMT